MRLSMKWCGNLRRLATEQAINILINSGKCERTLWKFNRKIYAEKLMNHLRESYSLFWNWMAYAEEFLLGDHLVTGYSVQKREMVLL